MKTTAMRYYACVLISCTAANALGDDTDSRTVSVRVGVKGEQAPIKLHGDVRQAENGTFDLPASSNWGWVAVGSGQKPLRELEGLQSLTICGWARPASLETGSGGNRIAFNLNYNRSGFDLVHHSDGRLRLAVNQWPDRITNDSSPRKLQVGKWVFFAVTYDSTKQHDNVHWYFGGPNSSAELDKVTSYNVGSTGKESGPLTVGNYNPTIQRHGTDRQFRGQLHAVHIVGSRVGADGALSLEAVRKLQADRDAQPDFESALPADLAQMAAAWRPTDGSDKAVPDVDIPSPPPGARPRIIATTDGEIDDRCSMVRFLMYANQWEIEGIIHSSSKFHWKGNGKDIKRHNWADEVWLDDQIDLYEEVYPNLSQHEDGFPTAEALRKLVYTGNVANVGDMSEDTPGSDRIVDVLLDDKPAPVYLQAWGGTNTIARALWKIQHEHPDQMDRVSKKAIIYIILDQDKTFRDYIQPNWPKLHVLGSFRQFGCIAYRWEQIIPRPQREFFGKAWMEKHILRKHGPLGAVYEARNGAFRSEGDSPSFMHQIDVGLRSLEHPGWGGWGGRFVQKKPGGYVWRGAKDDGDLNKPIWRWAEAFQNDWAARADWCVSPPADANHPPQVEVAGPLDRTVAPGEKVVLNVNRSSDPDGDQLSYRWWQYTDVDTVDAELNIVDQAARDGASFVVPEESGKTIHIILQVTDDGAPPLTRYQRVVFKIAS